MQNKTVQMVLDDVYQAMEQAEVYSGHGVSSTWDEAVFLVLHVVGLPLSSGEGVLNNVVSDQQYQQINQLLKQRTEKKIPLAYLMKKAWFAGLEFDCDERALVPRSPIAELIQVQFEPWIEPSHVNRILDLCTGSGCIGIACAHYMPNARIDLVDVSQEALDLAQQNIQKHDGSNHVKAILSDGFNALDQRQQYDIIVSNPPYVDQQDLKSMPSEFHHEPELGLASGCDGLDLTRRILTEAAQYLTDSGVLIVEVGNSQVALSAAYPQVPFTWLAFESGGDGVFLLTKSQLMEHQSCF